MTRHFVIATSFVIPMLLTGIIWFPLFVVYGIGSIMRGWPEIPGVIVLLVVFLFLSFAPQILLKKFNIHPKMPVLLFLLGFLLNILAIITTVLFLYSLEKISQ